MKKKKQICNHREKGLIWAGRFDWYKCSICGKEINMTTKPETKDQKKVLLVGRPLSPKLGMERVLVDGVLQYKAKWWMSYLPKWIVRIIAKLND